MAETASPLSLVRYVVVAAVAVVTAMVVVMILPTVFGPKKVRLVLLDGFVQVDPFPVLPPPNVTLRFAFMAYNPTKNDITYTKVRVHLLDIASLTPQVFNFSIEYPIHLESLQWTYYYDQEIALPHSQVPDKYVSLFYDENNVNVAMRVEGMLTTFLHGKDKKREHTRQVHYYCWPVILGSNSWFDSDIDVSCPQVDNNTR